MRYDEIPMEYSYYVLPIKILVLIFQMEVLLLRYKLEYGGFQLVLGLPPVRKSMSKGMGWELGIYDPS